MSKAAQKTTSKTMDVSEKKMTAKEMVSEAITGLNDRRGSSFAAIKKFISGQHPHVDLDHHNMYLKKFIKTSLENGSMLTSGVGLTGEFCFENHVKNNLTKKPLKTLSFRLDLFILLIHHKSQLMCSYL
jgi:hypothetical protein